MSRAGHVLRRLVFLLAIAAAAAAAQGRSCTTLQQNMYVRDVMTDHYLWYRRVPEVNFTAYSTPEAYLEAVRYRPLDRTFSFITSREAHDAFYSASQFIGFGFSTLLSGSEIRVTQVFPGSPAQGITLARGARILEVNGRTVIVVATRASASASELVINSLRPFMPVWVIGDRTYGKPVGQYGTRFCDKVLAAVSFTLRNADGQGDFYEGLQPDCPAADDVEHQLGDPLEGSLREALTVIATGPCSTAAIPSASPRRVPALPAGTGWQALVGAH